MIWSVLSSVAVPAFAPARMNAVPQMGPEVPPMRLVMVTATFFPTYLSIFAILGALVLAELMITLVVLPTSLYVNGALVTLVAYAPVGIAQLPRALPSPQVILAVTVLGVVCTALAFLLFFPLVAEVRAARATVITYVNPAVALALGVAFLGEPLTFGIVLGFVLIVLGSVLATRRTAPAKSVALSRSPDLL